MSRTDGPEMFSSFQLTPTDSGGSYEGGMVAKGVSNDCIFNEDFGYVFKSAIGAVVYKLRVTNVAA